MISTVPLNDPRLVSRAEHAFSLLPPAFRKHAVLAGGALRGVFDGAPTKDYDFFFLDTEKGKECYDLCKTLTDDLINRTKGLMYQRLDVSSSGVPTYTTLTGDVIQIIFLKDYPDVASLLNEFDFTCCCIAATYSDDGISVVELPNASKDAQAKVLVPICKQINGKDYKSRIDKFVKKGYTKPIDFDDLFNDAPVVVTVMPEYDEEQTKLTKKKLDDLYYESPNDFIIPPKFPEDAKNLKKLAAQLDNKQFKKSMASLAATKSSESNEHEELVTLESLQAAVAELKSTKEQILKNAATVDVYPYKVSSNVSEQKQFPAFWDEHVESKSSKESTK